MHIFIAADTYLHHPRNIFGFKKRTSKRVLRPVTTVLATSDGVVCHASQYKAKLCDDKNAPMVDYEYFGAPKSTGYNLDDLVLELNANDHNGVLFYNETAMRALDLACDRIYGDGLSAIGIENPMVISDFLADQLYRIDHRDLAMLSGFDYFASTIPLQTGGRYTINQVHELLWSYCDIMYPGTAKDAVTAIEHMRHNYNQVVNVIPSIIQRLKS